MDNYQPSTLGNLFYDICRLYPDNEAIIFKNQRITYRVFWKKVTALAKGLSMLGLRKGDHVGLWISNRPEFMYVQFAVALLGGILVVINPRYKTHELSHVLADLEINILIMIDKFLNNDYLDLVSKLIPELGKEGKGEIKSEAYPSLSHIVLLGDRKGVVPPIVHFDTLMEKGACLQGDDKIIAGMRQVHPNDTAMIMLTSGTSGLPKGAVLTHNSICWSNSWAFPRYSRITPDDRVLGPVPLTNTGGALSFSATSATSGSTLLLTEKFDPEESMVFAQNEGCTFIRGVPTMYVMWLSLPSLGKFNLSAIKRGITSGSPISPNVLEEVMQRITPNMFTAYGMTEFSCLTSQTVFSDSREKRLSTAGRAYQGATVKAFNTSTGQMEAAGTIGELCVRGPHVMKGYYKQPERTREAIDEDGWLHTGDIGFVDEEGYISIVGRSKEMLITGGFNVYPREVELVIEKHGKVKLATVVSVPDAVMGEVPAAFIEPKEGAELVPQEIVEFCKAEIANYKVPKYVRLVREWPMLGIGKIDKTGLRERLLKDLDKSGEHGIKVK